MTTQRQTGGLKTFVDDGTHNSPLSATDSAKIDDAYKKAAVRESKEARNIITVSDSTTNIVTIFFIVAVIIAIIIAVVMN